MTALVRYEAARYALKIAQQVDEVKDIRDKAQALAAYARQANDPELIQWATEIKLRAERRAGELLNGSERNKGAVARPDLETGREPKTLSELGLSEKQSSQFQAIAEIPEDKFEEKVTSGTATTASLVRESPKKKKTTEKEAKAPKKAKEPKAEPKPNEFAPDLAPDLADELERADKEIRSLQDLVVSLQSSDLAKEVVKWRDKFHKLEGRVAQLMTTEAECKKQAAYGTKMLADIRKVLKVERNQDILPALKK